MKLFSIYFILTFVLFETAMGQSTTILSGIVAELNGEPVVGASIAVKNLQIGTTSNNKGLFSIALPQKGKHVLQTSFVGYITKYDTIDVSENQYIRILLRAQTVSINEVVVREKFENTRNKKEVLSIEVIKNDFIIENNAGNLVKTIEKLPGVYAMDVGSGFSKPVIRGMGFNRVAVSENGIKQEGQQWGADHGLELDQFNVDKLEVYKGPMSLQYGSDAIGGLIKIVPPTIPTTNKMFGEVSLIGKSNNNLLGLSAMIGLKHNAWFVKSRITEQHFGDYKIPADTFVYISRPLPIYGGKLKNTAGYERDIATTVSYLGTKANSSVTISNVYQKTGFFPGSHGIPDINRIQNDGNDRNIELPNSNVNHLKIINNTLVKFLNWDASADLAFQNNRRQEWSKFHTHYGNQLPPITNPDLEIDFNLNTYSANLKLESKNDSVWQHIIGINSDFQSNSIAGYVFLLPEYKRFTAGGYVIESYNITKKVKLTGGLRFDVGRIAIKSFHDSVLQQYLTNMQTYSTNEIAFYSQRSSGISKQFSNITWSAGVVYNPDLQQIYKANIGRSFRLPGANELASNGVHHGTFRHERGDSALVSEKAYQLDFSYTFNNKVFYFSINPFVSWFSNYIYLNPTGNWSVLPHAGQIYQYTQAEALVSGGECTINYKFHKNLTYESSLEYVYLQNLSDGYPLPFSPPISIFNSLTWHLHTENKLLDEFHCKLENQLVGSQERIARNEKTSDAYSLWGISINNTVHLGKTKCNLSLQVQNLLNTKYFNHLSFYRKLNLPEVGRNIQLIVKVPIN